MASLRVKGTYLYSVDATDAMNATNAMISLVRCHLIFGTDNGSADYLRKFCAQPLGSCRKYISPPPHVRGTSYQ